MNKINPFLVGAVIALTVWFFVNLYGITTLESQIEALKAQLETYEPELPAGVTEPLTPETVMAIDMFCASWNEISHE